jgi:hypothetical protein
MEKSLKVDKKDREAPNGERNDLCRLMRKEASHHSNLWALGNRALQEFPKPWRDRRPLDLIHIINYQTPPLKRGLKIIVLKREAVFRPIFFKKEDLKYPLKALSKI